MRVDLGLAIGLASCILLLGYARQALQYNAHVPDADHMYVVTPRYHVDPTSPLFDVAPGLF